MISRARVRLLSSSYQQGSHQKWSKRQSQKSQKALNPTAYNTYSLIEVTINSSNKIQINHYDSTLKSRPEMKDLN